MTAAAAKSVAQQYVNLISTGQWASAWTLLAPSVQQKVPESTWLAVSAGCPNPAQGVALTVAGVTITGTTAVATVTVAGVDSIAGGVAEALTYSDGRWGVVPSHVSYFEQGSVAKDIATAKAAGACGK